MRATNAHVSLRKLAADFAARRKSMIVEKDLDITKDLMPAWVGNTDKNKVYYIFKMAYKQ